MHDAEPFHRPIKIRQVPGKGRGVFATRPIGEDELIITDTCLILTAEECELLAETSLRDYPLAHPENEEENCLALGPISLVNHSEEPNCHRVWTKDDQGDWTVSLCASRPIAEGEELTYRYRTVWFEVAG
jgi:uncharacterized protein